RGIISTIGIDPEAEISFVATPVSSIPGQVRLALDKTTGVVSDVGGVKLSVVNGVSDARFIGGHPMAGSELAGLDGADDSLFEGAVWVLTPTASSSDSSFESLAKIIRLLGAEIVVLDAERHDRLVAVVSHLPHLTAATLMGLAHLTAEEHVAVLRLAAGGFRDMTRVASGQPAIWIDICRENKDAILEALNGMISGLSEMRSIVETQDSDALLGRLSTARAARANLPGRVQELVDVCEVRVPIPDRSGAAAEIFQLAADLGVNIANFEVSHSVEGDRGILVMIVERENAEMFRGGLLARKFRPTIQSVA
ncbi:MAG: prephenate dehydrogenase/arogenate dehydrogenase family protein, partial [Actinomycetota bacterium]